MLKKTWEIYQVNLKGCNIVEKYKEIEEKYKGQQYDAVIVMPQSNKNLQGFYSISDQRFAT